MNSVKCYLNIRPPTIEWTRCVFYPTASVESRLNLHTMNNNLHSNSFATTTTAANNVISGEKSGVGGRVKKARGARPPVPGSEKGSSIFHEEAAPPMGQSEFGGGEKNDFHKMAPSPKPSERFEGRGFEPEGSADTTPPHSESNSNNSNPPYVR